MSTNVFSVVAAGLLVVWTAAYAGDPPKVDPDVATEAKKLEGTWAPTENILNGAPTPEAVLKSRRTVVKGDKYEGTVEGKVDGGGTWKFVARKGKVLHIDLYPVDGPGKGKVVKGIVEFVGDDGFRLCMPAEPDGERPTEFASKKGGLQVLRTYKRVKE